MEHHHGVSEGLDHLKRRSRRPAPKPTIRKNNIYVSRRSKFVTLKKYCTRLLEKGENEIHIRGMGLTIPVAVKLALIIQDMYPFVYDLETMTSTVMLTDDHIMKTEPTREIVRKNPAVHIRIFRRSKSASRTPLKNDDKFFAETSSSSEQKFRFRLLRMIRLGLSPICSNIIRNVAVIHTNTVKVMSSHSVCASFYVGENGEDDTYIPRRACMYVPGHDERKLKKIPTLNADCVILDCEDGVAINKKDDARSMIRRILSQDQSAPVHPSDFGPSEVCVRVNSIDSGLCEQDLTEILSAPILPSSLMIPKVEGPQQIKWMFTKLKQLLGDGRTREQLRPHLGLIFFIESARSLLELTEICKAAQQLSFGQKFVPEGLVFGSDDFCADIGAHRTKKATENFYARQYLVTVAKAFRLQAIDLVYIDYKDQEGLRTQCAEGASFGFTGKQVIHPSQVEIVQESFSPSPERIRWAEEIVQGFEHHQDLGKGAFVHEGRMIDMPLLLQAKNIVKLHEQIQRISARRKTDD